MAINPQDAAKQHTEQLVKKLCDVIDRRLIEYSEPYPFLFDFKRDTSPSAMNQVLDIYTTCGWNASLQHNDTQYLLQLYPAHEKQNEQNKASEDPLTPEQQKEAMDSMCSYVQTSLLYKSLARKFLTNTDTHLIGSNNEGRSPNIASNVSVLTTGKTHAENISELQEKIVQAILQHENLFLIRELKAKAENDKRIIGTYVQTTSNAINDAMARIISENEHPTKLLCSPEMFYKCFHDSYPGMDRWFEECTHREILTTGLFGHYRTLDVFVSPHCKGNYLLIVGQQPATGYIKINGSIADGARMKTGFSLKNFQKQEENISVDVITETSLHIYINAPVVKIDVNL